VNSDFSDPQDDTEGALSHIEDGRDKILSAQYRAIDQILAGMTPEAITIDLVEQGWDVNRAEEIAEYARQSTRSQRGVVTREDIAKGASIKYRKSQRRTAILIRLMLLAFAILIIWAVAKLNIARQSHIPGGDNATPRILPQNATGGINNRVGPATGESR
jgi:hypothetical protein